MDLAECDRKTGESASTDVGDLLAKMRRGDRTAAALFVERYGSRLRRRIRGQLNPAMKRIFDTEEVHSTVARRLDEFVLSRRIKATTERELWSLVLTMLSNAIVDKARAFERLSRIEGKDSGLGRAFANRIRAAQQRSADGADDTIDSALRVVKDEIDQRILVSWLNGSSHADTAEALGLTPAAVRQRWRRARQALRDHFGQDPEP